MVVAAEGAGQEYLADEPKARDASGNLLRGDFGRYLRRRVAEHFAAAGQVCAGPPRGTDGLLSFRQPV